METLFDLRETGSLRLVASGNENGRVFIHVLFVLYVYFRGCTHMSHKSSV